MNTNAAVVAPQNTLVKIIPNDKGNPPGKLADAEIHFVDGVFAGLKLIGFAIWERRTGAGRNVTFPARQYSVNGERRSGALLRPVAATSAHGAPGALRRVVLTHNHPSANSAPSPADVALTRTTPTHSRQPGQRGSPAHDVGTVGGLPVVSNVDRFSDREVRL